MCQFMKKENEQGSLEKPRWDGFSSRLCDQMLALPPRTFLLPKNKRWCSRKVATLHPILRYLDAQRLLLMGVLVCMEVSRLMCSLWPPDAKMRAFALGVVKKDIQTMRAVESHCGALCDGCALLLLPWDRRSW